MQTVAWKEHCVEYWLKELKESMDRCIGRQALIEILLKMALNTIQSINQSTEASPCLLGVLFTRKQHNILSKPLAAFFITIVKTMDSIERGMNPVAMTIISPRKYFWPSRRSNLGPPGLNPLPDDILDWPKLKQIADNILKRI